MANAFAGAMKAARIAAGLTQQEVSQRLGITRASVSQWEQGLASPSGANLDAIATLYGVDASTISEPGRTRGREGFREKAAASKVARDARREELLALWSLMRDQDREQVVCSARKLVDARGPAGMLKDLESKLAGLSADEARGMLLRIGAAVDPRSGR